MRKIPLLSPTLAIVAALFLVEISTKTASAEAFIEEKYGVTWALPDRWKIKKYDKKSTYAIVIFDDTEKKANILMVITERTQPPLEKWISTRMIPAHLRSYSELEKQSGDKYKEYIKKEHKLRTAKIDSGQEVNIRAYSLNIRGHKREIAFVYWVTNDVRYVVRVYNVAKHSEIAKDLTFLLTRLQVLSKSD